ncbi:MAG: cobalamin B12-binding domain-containing protein [Phycisphaerales bacterium]|nr:cobalamin B12-binding domain-containing protein [Phycisphaerales bacterium]
MAADQFVEPLFEALINGDRTASRRIIDQAQSKGLSPETVVAEVFWPTYEMVDRLYRQDQLTTLAHHLATRLLRTLTDQAASRFTRQSANGKTVFAFCGPTDADELGGQMATDLLEASGYTISYAGGGIATDEILATVQENRPDVLLMFASAPSDLPGIRSLIDQLREIGACDRIQIVVGGGVFNRAEGLAEEIGADLWAGSPFELVETMSENPARRAAADQRTVGRKRVKPAASTGAVPQAKAA